jgi:hypothetical protein
MTIMKSSPRLAWDISNVESTAVNLMVATFLAVTIKESGYHTSAKIPGAE